MEDTGYYSRLFNYRIILISMVYLEFPCLLSLNISVLFHLFLSHTYISPVWQAFSPLISLQNSCNPNATWHMACVFGNNSCLSQILHKYRNALLWFILLQKLKHSLASQKFIQEKISMPKYLYKAHRYYLWCDYTVLSFSGMTERSTSWYCGYTFVYLFCTCHG